MSSVAGSPVAVLFDIDGTLIDSAGAGGGALLRALAAEFEVGAPRAVPLHGRTDLGIMSELLAANGVPSNDGNLQRLCDHYYRLLPEELSIRSGRILPGVEAMLAALLQMPDCHLGLLTGNMPRSAQVKLEHFGLWRHFEFGIYGDQAVHRPHLSGPALAAVARRLAGETREARVVVVGDTPLDVALARAMRAVCLAVCTGGFTAEQLIQAGAPFVAHDLSDTERLLGWIFDQL